MRLVKKWLDYSDVGTAVVVAPTQKGDIIIDAGIYVIEAFNGTTPTLDMGFVGDNQGGAADPNALMSAVAAGTIGLKAADELAAATNLRCTVGDKITATFSVAGGTPTTGKAIAYAMIINENPLNDEV